MPHTIVECGVKEENFGRRVAHIRRPILCRGESLGGEFLKAHYMKKAFTLIELLVVVAIIAVIGAGVAVMYGREVVDDAKKQMTIHEMGQIRDAFNRFWADNSAQMMGGMTTADTSPTALPSSFEFVSGDSQTYTVPTTSEPQRLYGVMQFFERYGLWPLMQKSVFSKVRTVRHQIFQTSAEGSRRYAFMPPSPMSGNGWRGPYLNSVSARECVLNSSASGGNIVEAVLDSSGVTSGDSVADTSVRFPQPATKYDNGANGGIYRVFYYEHCANEYEGQPIYRRLILMAAIEPMQYDTWEEIKVFAGNRRYSSASGAPLNPETGAIDAYDEAHGVFFLELLNFDTVWR